jgi:hypothetical protein
VLGGADGRRQADQLCEALTRLLLALWDTYVRPASAVDADEQEQWRRQQERDAFAEVLTSIKWPELPDAQGALASYNPVVESAHSVGCCTRSANRRWPTPS